MPDVAFIALGSNLGDRDGHLAYARAALASLPGTRLLGASAVEETEPLGGMAQPRYLNQMIAVETDLTPRDLLSALHVIEDARGRRRDGRWSARTLDLDIVCIEGVTSHDPALTLPHPGLVARDFWQRELAAVRRMLVR